MCVNSLLWGSILAPIYFSVFYMLWIPIAPQGTALETRIEGVSFETKTDVFCDQIGMNDLGMCQAFFLCNMSTSTRNHRSCKALM